MALAKFDTSLTYSVNVVEFWNLDTVGEPVEFAAGTAMYISRIDDPTKTITIHPAATDVGYVKFTVDLTGTHKLILKKDTDSVYDYNSPVFDHIYSVKATGVGGNTYVYGKLNILEVA